MESVKNYMDWGMDDIVFENRNKAYGSYQNKKAISQNVMIGLTASILGFVMLVLVQGIDWSSLDKTSQEKENITRVNLRPAATVKLSPPPPLLVPVLPPPPVRPSVRFTQMIVKEQEPEMDENEDQAPVEETKQPDISTVTNVGDTTVTLVFHDKPSPVVKVVPVLDTTVYDFVDQRPEFPGGDAALDAFVQSHIIHPEGESNNGEDRKVLVVFVVKEDGSVADPRVPIGVSAVLAKEALRVVKTLPKFKPGRLQGRAVRVYFHIPVSFDLKTM